MSTADAMAERHTEVLAELAGLGLDMARGLKARAEAAQTAAEAEGLALAFHRIARAVRLTLALESRLVRERGQIEVEQRAAVRRAVADRKQQVQDALSRDLWTERDDGDGESLHFEANERLDEAAAWPGFLDQPLEVQVAWLRAELGLPANDAGPPIPTRRSSG